MTRKLLSAVAIVAIVLLAGCGGGGSSPAAPPRPITKENVLSLLVSGIRNSANLRTADAGGDRSPRHARKTRDGGADEKYYDEALGLWVQLKPGLNDQPTEPSGELYFVDEALTQPAGHRLTWISEPDTYPISGKEELIYAAGTFAGERDLYEWTIDEDGSGTSRGEGTDPGVGRFVFQGGWNEAGLSNFTERFDAADGAWQTFTLHEAADLSYTLAMTSSVGVKFTLNFRPDQSGTGKLEGPADALPATLTWDIDGNATLTWSDRTTRQVNIYDL
jgi:hypothetical protein